MATILTAATLTSLPRSPYLQAFVSSFVFGPTDLKYCFVLVTSRSFSHSQPQPSLIDTLRYPGDDARLDQLANIDADEITFEWLWTSPFARWLESEETVFWITGKPASGKSMLMSYVATSDNDLLSQHSRVYFFFNHAATSSTSDSNSVNGLKRSILVQLCDLYKALEEAMQIRFKLRTSYGTRQQVPTRNELKKMMDFAFQFLEQEDEHIFLLLDGLDDYRGSYVDIAEVVQDFEHRPTIQKLCVASRPEEFKNQLEGWQRLKMEYYNGDAIERYAELKLSRLKHTNMHPMGAPNNLAKTIVKRAEGVFLWAALATKEMCSCYMRHESSDKLEQRLKQLPSELSGYYDRIIDQMEDEREDWIKIMKLVELDGSPDHNLTISEIYHAARLLDLSCVPGPRRIADTELQDFARRVVLRTKGLINLEKHPLSGYQLRERREGKNTKVRISGVLCWVRLAHRSIREHIHHKVHDAFPSMMLWSEVFQEVLRRNEEVIFSEPALASPPRNYESVNSVRSAKRDTKEVHVYDVRGKGFGKAQPGDHFLQWSLNELVMTRLPNLIRAYEDALQAPVPADMYHHMDIGFVLGHIAMSDLEMNAACFCDQILDRETPLLQCLVMHGCVHTLKYCMQEARSRYHATRQLRNSDMYNYDHSPEAQGILFAALSRVSQSEYEQNNLEVLRHVCTTIAFAANNAGFIGHLVQEAFSDTFQRGHVEVIATVLELCLPQSPFLLWSGSLCSGFPDLIRSVQTV